MESTFIQIFVLNGFKVNHSREREKERKVVPNSNSVAHSLPIKPTAAAAAVFTIQNGCGFFSSTVLASGLGMGRGDFFASNGGAGRRPGFFFISQRQCTFIG